MPPGYCEHLRDVSSRRASCQTMSRAMLCEVVISRKVLYFCIILYLYPWLSYARLKIYTFYHQLRTTILTLFLFRQPKGCSFFPWKFLPRSCFYRLLLPVFELYPGKLQTHRSLHSSSLFYFLKCQCMVVCYSSSLFLSVKTNIWKGSIIMQLYILRRRYSYILLRYGIINFIACLFFNGRRWKCWIIPVSSLVHGSLIFWHLALLVTILIYNLVGWNRFFRSSK